MRDILIGLFWKVEHWTSLLECNFPDDDGRLGLVNAFKTRAASRMLHPATDPGAGERQCFRLCWVFPRLLPDLIRGVGCEPFWLCFVFLFGHFLLSNMLVKRTHGCGWLWCKGLVINFGWQGEGGQPVAVDLIFGYQTGAIQAHRQVANPFGSASRCAVPAWQ